MESINPDDIDDIDHKQITAITLKNGSMITIDGSVPSKRDKNNREKNIPHNNYQISQKLINLTIISKREKPNNLIINFNSKNKICQNIYFFYTSTPKENNKKEDMFNNKKIDYSIEDIIKEKNKKSFLFENLGNNNDNIITENNENINNNIFINKKGIIKNELNKEDKEIEKLKTIENDIDSLNDKSKNEFKTIINEFDIKTKNRLKLEQKLNNINILLNSNIKTAGSKNFDFTNHFNSLVRIFKNRKKDIKKDNVNKRYYEDYKRENKFKSKNLLNKSPFKMYNIDINNNYNKNKNKNTINNKYLTSSSVLKSKDIILRNNNNNIIYVKDKIFNKHSSFDPKIFRTLYLGQQIILPSNKLN